MGDRILGSSKLWLWMTCLLGITFLGFQAYEFTSFVHEGLTIRTNLFGSSFFTLTGFHGAHVTAGVHLAVYAAGDRLQARAATGRRGAGGHLRAVLALRRRGLDRDLHAHLPDQVRDRTWLNTLRPQARAEEHPTWSTYWKVALILTIITAVEVSAYYIPAWETSWVYVPSMLIMSAVKFGIVVHVLHAPQVRPQAVPDAVYRSAHDCRD